MAKGSSRFICSLSLGAHRMEPDEQKSLWEELLELWTPEEAELFLRTPQPFLDGGVPSVEMAKGNFEPIWHWIEGTKGMVAT